MTADLRHLKQELEFAEQLQIHATLPSGEFRVATGGRSVTVIARSWGKSGSADTPGKPLPLAAGPRGACYDLGPEAGGAALE